MQDLIVSLIQTPLYWEDPVANRAMLEEKIAGIDKTDVIVLPEMFTTSFTNNVAKFAEPMNLNTFKWMKQLASQTCACIVFHCQKLCITLGFHLYCTVYNAYL